jgi:hypothetical protein
VRTDSDDLFERPARGRGQREEERSSDGESGEEKVPLHLISDTR